MWFLDTGYLIALFSEKDAFHVQAIELRDKALAKQQLLMTTEAVLFEVGAAFSKVAHRKLGSELIQALLNDPLVNIVSLTPERRDRAIALSSQRLDKVWSLCDCLSFCVMRENGVEETLTPDNHFTQAGFVALLLNDKNIH